MTDPQVLAAQRDHAILMELNAIRGLLHALLLYHVAPSDNVKLAKASMEYADSATERTARYLAAYEAFEASTRELAADREQGPDPQNPLPLRPRLVPDP